MSKNQALIGFIVLFFSYPQPAMMASLLTMVSLMPGRQTGLMVEDQTASSASLIYRI